MSYAIIPIGKFEYVFDGESHQVEPVQIGSPLKTAARQFKDDTETWSIKFEAKLVDGSVVYWDIHADVGYSAFHDTSSSGVQGVPASVEVTRDPDFLSVPVDDEEL